MPKKEPKVRKRGTRGPPADGEIVQLAKLSKNWREDCEETLLVLQQSLRGRANQMDAFELIGAIRACSDALTTNQALVPDKPEKPA